MVVDAEILEQLTGPSEEGFYLVRFQKGREFEVTRDMNEFQLARVQTSSSLGFTRPIETVNIVRGQ